jgi:hypothetical protein
MFFTAEQVGGQVWQMGLLGRVAIRYPHRGWPVVPAAFLIGDRYVCGSQYPRAYRHLAAALGKVHFIGLIRCERWWAEVPFLQSLLSAGDAVDVIEAPSDLDFAI